MAAPIVSFEPAVNYPVGVYPQSVEAGDFDGDGWPDMATANWTGNNVSVLMNRGDGTFQPAVNYNVGNRPEKVSVGDFNGDSRPDLVTANYGSSNLSILMNNGDGTFQPAVNCSVSGFPKSLEVGDVNGDGRDDLAIASGNDFFYWIYVIMNNGDGTFRAPVRYNLVNTDNPPRVALEDLNGDCKPDLVTASYWGANVAVLMNRGDGTFESVVNYANVNGSRDLAVEDFNGDGRPDLATAAQGSSVSILLNRGDGTFQPGAGYSVGFEPRSLAAGDFNGDGKPDLAASSTSDSVVYVMINRGDGTFGLPEQFSAGSQIWRLAEADFNGDGKLDLTSATGYLNTVSVLINTTDFGNELADNPPADTVSPATTLNLYGTPGNNGWFVSDVRAVLTAEDSPCGTGVAKTEYSFDGSSWNTYTGPFDITGEGLTTVYYRSADKAFNIGAAEKKVIKIDKSAPRISINLPAEGWQYNLGQQITAGWKAADTVSGLQSEAGTTLSGSLIDTNSVGMKAYNVKAVDNAGNEAEVTVNYQVTYIFSGFLQPADSGEFNLGSTVPVKFWLKDANGNFITNAAAGLYVDRIIDGAEGAQPAVSRSKAVPDNTFRSDLQDNQYIFNLDTQGMSTGLWQLGITLDDGTTHYGTISLN